MLRIFDKSNNLILLLDKYKDLKITKKVALGDKSLSFITSSSNINLLENEGYIETDDDRYVIKEIRPKSDATVEVYCQLDVEALEGKTFLLFESVEHSISEAMSLAFVGTGWTVKASDIFKNRTLRKSNCTALDVVKQALSVYRCECIIDSKNHQISFCEEVGADKGAYFMNELNLRSLNMSKTSYDFYTEIEPYGKDGLTIASVNDGVKYLWNYSYSNKSKRLIWKDDRYTIPKSLKEDAQAKLDDYSKPYVSYSADIIDLAALSSKYSILDFDIGDTITLIDIPTNTHEKQRIVEMTIYPDQPERNSCTLANLVLTFEELSSKYNEAAETVENVTTSSGNVDGTTVEGMSASQLTDLDSVVASTATIANLQAEDVSISGRLTAVTADIGTLNANVANFEEATVNRFNAVEGSIASLKSDYVDVAIADIDTLNSNYAAIQNLLAGNVTGEQAEFINLSSLNTTVDIGWFKDLMAQHITVNDLLAGAIYTNKHTVMSEDGAMTMNGSLLTFKDAGGNIRIQIGKDGQGNYNYYLVNDSGDIIWDAAGITADGVPDGLIVDDMIADSDGTYNGISPSKLNIHLMVGALNEEGGLKSSSIVLDDENQSLTVAFSNMKESINNLSKGGRNLILNTLVPDVSNPVNYPKIKGQATSTVIRGTATTAEHGVRSTGSATVSPGFIFGSNISGAMNGLEAGETYTISFDAAWKLYSADTSTDKKELYMVIGYIPTQNSDFVYEKIVISEVTSGVAESFGFNATFTVPEQCIATYIGILDKDYIEINDVVIPYLPYAEGDYVEINGESVQVSAFGGNDCFEVNGVSMPKQNNLCLEGDYIELSNLKLEKGIHNTEWTPAPEDYLVETSKIKDLIDDVQDQIDGVVDTYYYDYAPTLNNIPASDWSTSEYPSHKGDIFLDTTTGKSYRFLENETTHVWSWVEIPDTASAEALRVANDAADLADHKRRIFVDTPYVPYDVGDLWFEGVSGDILTCTTAKTTNQQYAIADWSKLNKYTDDTATSNLQTTFDTTIGEIRGSISAVEIKANNNGKTIATHSSTIKQLVDKINLVVTDTEIEDLPEGFTTMYNKLAGITIELGNITSALGNVYTKKDVDGKVAEITSEQSSIKQSLNQISANVTSVQSDLHSNYSTTTVMNGAISASAQAVEQRVSQTYVTNSSLEALERRVNTAEQKITDSAIVSTVRSYVGIGDENLLFNSTGISGSVEGWELTQAPYMEEGQTIPKGAPSWGKAALIADVSKTIVHGGLSGWRLRFTNNQTVSSASSIANSIWRQGYAYTFTLKASTTYTISGYYCCGNSTLTNTDSPYMWVRRYKSGSASSTNISGSLMRFSEKGTWTYFTRTFTTKSDDENAQGFLQVTHTGNTKSSATVTEKSLYLRELVLVEGSQPMVWAESSQSVAASVITQTADKIYAYADSIRLKATTLVWTATNSSMSENGTLRATNAILSGSITATSGSVAGWNMNNYRLWKSSSDDSSGNAYMIYLQSAATSDGTTGPSATTNALVTTRKFTINGASSWKNLYELRYDGRITSYGYNVVNNVIRNTNYYRLADGSFEFRYGTAWNSSGTMSTYKYLKIDVNGLTTNGKFVLGNTAVVQVVNTAASDNVILGRRGGTGPYIGYFYGNSGMTLAVQAATSGYEIIGLYKPTSDDTLSSGDTYEETILRYKASSSKRYKTYLGDETDDDALKLLNIPVVRFKYKDGYLGNDDENYDKSIVGLFAEDVADQYSDAVYHKNGYIENYTDRQLLVRLIKLVQIQNREIEQLKSAVN